LFARKVEDIAQSPAFDELCAGYVDTEFAVHQDNCIQDRKRVPVAEFVDAVFRLERAGRNLPELFIITKS